MNLKVPTYPISNTISLSIEITEQRTLKYLTVVLNSKGKYKLRNPPNLINAIMSQIIFAKLLVARFRACKSYFFRLDFRNDSFYITCN